MATKLSHTLSQIEQAHTAALREATTSANGLMSATDKANVDSLAAGDDDAFYHTHLEDHDSLPLLCGQPMILFGAGTPQESVVPDNWIYDPTTDKGYAWDGTPSAVGQQYINTSVTSGGRYIAVRSSYDKLNSAYWTLKWLNF